MSLSCRSLSQQLRPTCILREAGVIRTIRTDSRAWMCMNRSVLRGFANYVNLVTERSPVTVARSGPGWDMAITLRP